MEKSDVFFDLTKLLILNGDKCREGKKLLKQDLKCIYLLVIGLILQSVPVVEIHKMKRNCPLYSFNFEWI